MGAGSGLSRSCPAAAAAALLGAVLPRPLPVEDAAAGPGGGKPDGLPRPTARPSLALSVAWLGGGGDGPARQCGGRFRRGGARPTHGGRPLRVARSPRRPA